MIHVWMTHVWMANGYLVRRVGPFSHKSIGLLAAGAWNGIAIFRPSPAEA
jgi:hypothetical protein